MALNMFRAKLFLTYDEYGHNFVLFAFCLNLILIRDNYTKPPRGLARLHFAYPWFKTYHFAHLKLVLLAFRNPPLCLPLEKHIFRLKQI